MDEGDILRQRRNLVAMSCLLIVFDLAKVEVAKVGVLGTDLVVGDVRVLAISMWVVWAYFLLRYYQYWRFDRPHVSKALFDVVESYSRRFAIENDLDRANSSGAITLHRGGWLRDWRVQLNQYQPGGGDLVMIEEERVPWATVAAWRLKSWWRIAVHTPHFTEHALPLVLAAATPVVAVLTKIFAQP